jgi:hypothetical protein
MILGNENLKGCKPKAVYSITAAQYLLLHASTHFTE